MMTRRDIVPDSGGVDFYLMSTEAVLRRLRVTVSEGLSAREVGRRQSESGLNRISTGDGSRWIVLLFDRFRDILFLILTGAAAVSILAGHYEDAIIIAVAIFLDAGLSFAQVWRTEKTLARMRENIADTITVLREGRSAVIPSSELVPGDIIEFSAGEKVPADARLIEAKGLRTSEATLTGEAYDIEKQTSRLTSRTSIGGRTNMIFAGTLIVSGSGRAVVCATGSRMEFGKIAQMLKQQRSPDSPLRRKLQQTGLRIGWVIIGAVIILAGLDLRRGASLVDAGRTAITLIVSAIPEDLTMILTIALTVGVTRILKKGGVVKRLASGETLGAATVICTDKTGTLTEGNMRAEELTFLQGDVIRPRAAVADEPWHHLALVGLAVANNAHAADGDTEGDALQYVGSATERSALQFVESIPGMRQMKLLSQWRTRDTISFSPEWKYQAVLCNHPTQGTQTIFVTGAPDILLERSSQTLSDKSEPVRLSAAHRAVLQKKIENLAMQGYRLLAVAVKRNLETSSITHDDIHELLWLGVLTITDPIRPEVAQAIAETRAAGVQIKLITGDHAGTARAAARAVGLPAGEETVCDCETLQRLSDEELTEYVKTATIFARVEPLDKQRIVRILQDQGHVVAMTGDGVNDAVALKGADIGIAMGSGSDVAKDASDLILLNNSLATITAAIKEGRVLRDNIRKVVAFLLATNAAEVAIFFVSLLLGLPLPLLPAQILWINLVTDGTSDIALSLEPGEGDVMRRNPEDPQKPLFSRKLVIHTVFSGLVMTTGTMLLFWYLIRFTGNSLEYARTMAFAFLAVASLLSVWSFRSLKQPIIGKHLQKNYWVFASTGFSMLLQLGAIYLKPLQGFFDTVPLMGRDWLIIIAMAIVTVALVDVRKYLWPIARDEWSRPAPGGVREAAGAVSV